VKNKTIPIPTSEQVNANTLHQAAENGTPEEIRALLQAGTDVNARDFFGNTALHEAAAHNENLTSSAYWYNLGHR